MGERILQLLPTADAPRYARAHIHRVLGGVLDGHALEDAVLLASELVVARLVVGTQDDDRRIAVGARCDEDTVVVRVSSTGERGSGREDMWWPSDGHGVHRVGLLDRLTTDWGAEAGPPLSIWFTMRRPQRQAPADG
jgi:hypothetical protein